MIALSALITALAEVVGVTLTINIKSRRSGLHSACLGVSSKVINLLDIAILRQIILALDFCVGQNILI